MYRKTSEATLYTYLKKYEKAITTLYPPFMNNSIKNKSRFDNEVSSSRLYLELSCLWGYKICYSFNDTIGGDTIPKQKQRWAENISSYVFLVMITSWSKRAPSVSVSDLVSWNKTVFSCQNC